VAGDIKLQLSAFNIDSSISSLFYTELHTPKQSTMAFPLPQGISTYHTKPYPAIDISRPELSTTGRVVFITGGGSGLGLAFAQHFAAAGSTQIAITGRRQKVLLDAQKLIQGKHPATKVLTLQSDVVDRDGVIAAFKKTAETFGKVDILVNNAGYLPAYELLGSETLPDDWWSAFSINVRGSHNVLSAFLPVATQNATVLNLTSAAVNAVVPGQSGYTASKIAAARVFECFAAENPGFRVVNVAPGVVMTEMHEKTVQHFENKGWPQLPLDDSKFHRRSC
jgi:NAD(P)-dependent dehydrogenase (short-subunit alcohol dehydrogenase family)